MAAKKKITKRVVKTTKRGAPKMGRSKKIAKKS